MNSSPAPALYLTLARATPLIAAAAKISTQIAWTAAGLAKIAQHMFSLMLRNVASDGFVFTDSTDSSKFSLPGCIIASPSFPSNTEGIDQDYVYNWTRDAAIAAIEIAAANIPDPQGAGVLPLVEYADFAQTCQNNANAAQHFARASFTIEGQVRDRWSDQNDGPALQTIALLNSFGQLDGATQTVVKTIINANVNFLMGVYQNQTINLWEEYDGFSFFARSVQLRCFQAIKANTLGIPVPAGIDNAIGFLQNALGQHWINGRYQSLIPPPSGYDANIDIVCACIYGAVPCTDTKLLATAAQLRSQ